MSKQPKRSRGNQNRLRIIGGQWRGRKLDFPDVEGLRPTPDRIRETLFNWLRQDVRDTLCLDLFSGSGALGLEALSRGAKFALLVDNNAEVVSQLRNHVKTLQADACEIRQIDALTLLSSPPEQGPFDLAFLDPPFGKDLIVPCIKAMESQGWLAENAKIYIEVESDLQTLNLPQQWRVIREQKAGQVCCKLLGRQSEIK